MYKYVEGPNRLDTMGNIRWVYERGGGGFRFAKPWWAILLKQNNLPLGIISQRFRSWRQWVQASVRLDPPQLGERLASTARM